MALFTNQQFVGLAVVAGVAALMLYKKTEELQTSIVEKAGAVATKINPASTENIIYSTITDVGRSVTTDENYTLGGSIYDMVDSVRGLWGDSDQDRIKEAESAYIAARKNGIYETVGGGGW